MKLTEKVTYWFLNPLNRMRIVRTLVSLVFWGIILLFMNQLGSGLMELQKNLPLEEPLKEQLLPRMLILMKGLGVVLAIMASIFIMVIPMGAICFRAWGWDLEKQTNKRRALVTYLRKDLSRYAYEELILQTKLFVLFGIVPFGIIGYYAMGIAIWIFKVIAYVVMFCVKEALWLLSSLRLKSKTLSVISQWSVKETFSLLFSTYNSLGDWFNKTIETQNIKIGGFNLVNIR